MQGFIDLVTGFAGGVQKVMVMVLLSGLALSAIVGLTIYGTAPIIAEEAGERMEKYVEARMEHTLTDSRAMHCERLRAKASKIWNEAVDNGTEDRVTERIDELDRQAGRICNPPS